ncbi:MAG: glycosyl transferase group 1 [Phycisphaerales bacterium]|nr:glycosyl transferase group 1 [Phycisphaerales bacterium]
MRIVHTISGIEPESGGPTSALCGLVRAQAKLGHKPHIVGCWKFASSFKLADELRADGIDVTIVGPTRWPFYRHPDLGPSIEAAAADADLIHVHAMWDAVNHLSAVAARKLKKPYVWTPHGMLDRWNMRRNGLFKRACLAAFLRRDLNDATLLNVATDFEAENVARWKLRPPVFIKGFGLSDELLSADIPRGRYRQQIGLTSDVPMVLFLGRIQRGKGLETLIPALAALQHRDAVLVIAGPDEGTYRQQIESLIAAHGVTARVKFVGMISGASKLEALTDADVLAAPSAHENFGISVAEALALGTPVVVSDQVGLADFIREHDLGRVAPVEVAATAAALDVTLTRDEARSARSRTLARTAFAWPTIATAWMAEYARILDPTRG